MSTYQGRTIFIEMANTGNWVECDEETSPEIQNKGKLIEEDPQYLRMKYWEITGQFIKDDGEGDVVVTVSTVKQILVP